MESYEPYISLGVALGVGLLVGLEREQSRPAPEEHRGFAGGIRTYPLIALSGALGALLARAHGPWPLVALTLALGSLLAVGYARDAAQGHAGLTTEVSALITFALGALALSPAAIDPLPRRIFVVGALAVATTLLLAQKTELRAFSAKVSKDDVFATLKFLVVAVVMLPLLPDEAVGPWGALNPFHVGVVVVSIAGVDFVGYAATRLLGGRGLVLSGAIGGLVSSTAVTLASAGRAKREPQLGPLAALAVIVACNIMVLRVLGFTAVASAPVAQAVAAPLAVMALVGFLSALLLWLKEAKNGAQAAELTLKNPFELSSAVKFAAFFVVISLVARWASARFGASGLYAASALAGLTDVDAITLSMSNLVSKGELDPAVAARAVVVAVVSNSLVKAGMAVALGGGVFARRVALVLGVAVALGLLVAFALG